MNNRMSNYCVVSNQEQQFSIWLTHKEIPRGWKAEGFTGSKEECLDYIEAVWEDLRPLSLRKAMEQVEK